MDTLIENIKNIDLKKYNIIKIKKDSLVIFKSKYKYTDCIYINLVDSIYSIKYDRVFDNKNLDYSVERLMIFKQSISSRDTAICTIESLLK